MGAFQSRSDPSPSPNPALPGAFPNANPANPATTAAPPPPTAGPSSTTTSRSSNPLYRYFITPLIQPSLIHDHHPANVDALSGEEILEVQDILILRGLPPELVPSILEYAELWTVCSRVIKKQLQVAAGARRPRMAPQNWRNGQEQDLAGILELDDSGLTEANGSIWYLVSEPIGCQGGGKNASTRKRDTTVQLGEPGCYLRKIVIETESVDQGWSDEVRHYGTYEQSYTWFDVSLLRDGREVEGSRMDIQHNVHAGQYYKTHRNVLDTNHRFFRMAQAGDRIALWVRAAYPGWCNNVREGSITIYTSPFP